MLSLVEGTVVQEAKIDRFFDLVGIIPRQKHIGNMGLNQLNRILRRMRIKPRLQHLLNQGGECGISHRFIQIEISPSRDPLDPASACHPLISIKGPIKKTN